MPKHRAFFYVDYAFAPKWSVVPSLELASEAWSSVLNASSAGLPSYVRTDAYALVGLQLEYDVNSYAKIAFGVRNLLDEDYEVQEGYPEPGRSFFVNARATF